MGEFFKGWRRKAGLVTLVLACVLAVGWVRSYFIPDVLTICMMSSDTIIISDCAAVTFHCPEETDEGTFGIFWESDRWHPSLEATDAEFLYIDDDLNGNTWQWGGLRVGTAKYGNGRIVMISYALLVLPLTLLTAWLILGKPRKAKNVPQIQPAETSATHG